MRSQRLRWEGGWTTEGGQQHEGTADRPQEGARGPPTRGPPQEASNPGPAAPGRRKRAFHALAQMVLNPTENVEFYTARSWQSRRRAARGPWGGATLRHAVLGAQWGSWLAQLRGRASCRAGPGPRSCCTAPGSGCEARAMVAPRSVCRHAGRRAMQPPAIRGALSAGAQAMREGDLAQELRRRVYTLQSPPGPMRGALKNALGAGLAEVHSETHAPRKAGSSSPLPRACCYIAGVGRRAFHSRSSTSG